MFMHRIRALMGVAAVSAAAVIGSAVPALAAANQSAATSGTGYDVLTPNGGGHNFGAPWYGSDAGKLGNLKAVGLAEDPQSGGYWILKSDAGVSNYNAPWYGSIVGPNTTVSGITNA
jgi:hypothetical protein